MLASDARRQETALSDLEGPFAVVGVGALPIVDPPKETPPEITEVDGVRGGLPISTELEALKLGAFVLKPLGIDLLPNLPPSAAVIGIAGSFSFSSRFWRRELRSCAIALVRRSKEVCAGPALAGIRVGCCGLEFCEWARLTAA